MPNGKDKARPQGEHGVPLDFNNTPPSRDEAHDSDHDNDHDNRVPISGESEPHWPEPLKPEAFHGLAGEMVRTIEPTSEADPAALLAQLLVGFGNVIGHGPFYAVESTRHALNLFAVLVGKTSKARKGTAWGRNRQLLQLADQTWGEDRIQSGLSSGEGLIEAVRDPKDENDQGVADKRLLVMQGEFCAVLKVMERDGNILSAIIRDAWDHGDLRTLTRKTNSLSAKGAHISVIGHITRDELRRYLSETEQANGFANRFLWFAVTRSKLLPDGADLRAELSRALVDKLKPAITFARGVRQMIRDADARAIWHSVYGELSEGHMGLLGAVTSRAESQVLRLSCVYALLDKSAEVRAAHLNAALAVWRYAEDSCRYIFGEAMGDSLVDSILSALKDAADRGMTKTEIGNLFGRNQSGARITNALTLLHSLGKISFMPEETGGRPAQRWFFIASTKETN